MALFAAGSIARDDGWPDADDPLGQVGEDEDVTNERGHSRLRRNTAENARVISWRFRTEMAYGCELFQLLQESNTP